MFTGLWGFSLLARMRINYRLNDFKDNFGVMPVCCDDVREIGRPGFLEMLSDRWTFFLS